jgi:VWFA-related protein
MAGHPISALACVLGIALASGAGPLATSQAGQQFHVSVDVVEVTVTVTDDVGRPVRNLTRGDFEILDEGQPQSIAVFSQVELSLPSSRRGGSIVPLTVGSNAFASDGRVFALVLDDQLTQPFRTLSVRKLAREFVEGHVGASDLVGVFSTGGRGALTQEFTTDHARVLAAIDRFQGNRIRRGPETDAERVYGIETAMETIAALAGHLQGIRGRRVAAVFISEGIDYNIYQAMRPSTIPGNLTPAAVSALLGARGERSTGATEDREPQATPVIRAIQRAMDALSRANVVLYGVDPRGLYSTDGEWIEFSAQDKTSAPPPSREEHARSIESLRFISDRTGGFALVNTNDFGSLFGRIVQESSHYYVLGYSPSRRGKPGEYRRITVRVKPGLRVSGREGYVVPGLRPSVATPRPVLAALDDSLPLPHLPLRVMALPLGRTNAEDEDRRQVQVIVEIDGPGLAFREENGRFVERLELAVKTLNGVAVEEHRSATEMTLPPLSPAQRDRIGRTGVRWLAALTLRPGRHVLRVAAHSLSGGRTGSVFTDLEVAPLADPFYVSDLVVTASSSAEAPTAGQQSILPLPGPPTTRRTFGLGEEIAVGAVLDSRSSVPPSLTAGVDRLDGDLRSTVLRGIPSVSRADGEGDVSYVVYRVATTTLQPGRYAIRLEVGDVVRETIIDFVPPVSR